MTEPLVSVLIRAWNCERYIGLAIESVLAQTFQDFEIVVVNDASTDGTQAILQTYAQQDKRIKVIRNEMNKGPVRTINIGLQQTQGEFVAIQDGDDLSLPHRLETQVEFFRANPNIALIGGGSYAIDEEGEEFQAKTWPCRRMGPEEARQYLETGLTFTHSSFMFRRASIEAIGLYDEFFLYAHDYDMLLRMAERFDVVYYEEPLVKWRMLNTGITGRNKRTQMAFNQMAEARIRAARMGEPFDLEQEFNRTVTRYQYCDEPVSVAAYYYSVGIQMLEKGKTRQARKRFLKAWKHQCTMSDRLRILSWYFLSFLPNLANSKLVRIVRQNI